MGKEWPTGWHAPKTPTIGLCEVCFEGGSVSPEDALSRLKNAWKVTMEPESFPEEFPLCECCGRPLVLARYLEDWMDGFTPCCVCKKVHWTCCFCFNEAWRTKLTSQGHWTECASREMLIGAILAKGT
jgi:hypothetical protein